MGVRIRHMKLQDLDFAFSLVKAEGWSTSKTDLNDLLIHDNLGCYIAELNDESIGMVTGISFGMFGFIGNLIVIDSMRGHGIGTLLMNDAIKSLSDRGVRAILLDGVEKAIPLYERLGFRKLYKSLRFKGILKGEVSEYVSSITPDDIPELLQLDTYIFRADRSSMILSWMRTSPHLCRKFIANDKIVGYIIGCNKGSFAWIGPWIIKRDTFASEVLLLDLCHHIGDRELRLGVLESNETAVKILKKNGLCEADFSWRMVLGEKQYMPDSDNILAIALPDRG